MQLSAQRNSTLVARNGSSNRVKPFSSNARPQRIGKQFVARAAEEDDVEEVVLQAEEPEVAVVAEDFVFNYNEAKRNNEYQPSDVATALAFYSEGTGDLPFEADFVSNPLGIEDAGLFDDVDYGDDMDEYAAVGIPEAAPKSKGRGRRGQQQEEEGLTDEQLMVGTKLSMNICCQIGHSDSWRAHMSNATPCLPWHHMHDASRTLHAPALKLGFRHTAAGR